jgi:hypothetical protein
MTDFLTSDFEVDIMPYSDLVANITATLLSVAKKLVWIHTTPIPKVVPTTMKGIVCREKMM